MKKDQVGYYLGNATYIGNEKLYNVWHSMLRRCYDESHIRHNAYHNVTVCSEWFCFEQFLKDVETIDGWNKEQFINGELQLDKDYKQMDKKEKIYSKNTCIWISKKDNNSYQPNHCKKFKMIATDGSESIYYSQHLCAKENGLSVTQINKCLKGQHKTHKKYKFQYCQ